MTLTPPDLVSPAELLHLAATRHPTESAERALELTYAELAPHYYTLNCYELAKLALRFAQKALITKNLLKLAAGSAHLMAQALEKCSTKEELLFDLRRGSEDALEQVLSQLTRLESAIQMEQQWDDATAIRKLSPYDPELTAVHQTTRAEGLVLVVVKGDRGTACEIRLNPSVASGIPETLRTLAEAIENDINKARSQSSIPN